MFIFIFLPLLCSKINFKIALDWFLLEHLTRNLLTSIFVLKSIFQIWTIFSKTIKRLCRCVKTSFIRRVKTVLTATEGNTTTQHTKAKLVPAMMDGVKIHGSPALYIPFNFPKGRHITCHWYHCTLINFIIENHNSLFVRLGNRYPPCSAWFVTHEYSWVADFFSFPIVWHRGHGLTCNADHTTCSLSNFLDTVWYILITINWLCFTFFTR